MLILICLSFQTNSIELALTQKVKPQLTELADIFDSPVSNQTALGILLNTLSSVRNNTTMAVGAAADIKRPIASINMDQSLEVHIFNTIQYFVKNT